MAILPVFWLGGATPKSRAILLAFALFRGLGALCLVSAGGGGRAGVRGVPQTDRRPPSRTSPSTSPPNGPVGGPGPRPHP